MTKMSWMKLGAIALSMSVLVMTGCSDDSEDTGSTPTPDVNVTPDTTPDPTPDTTADTATPVEDTVEPTPDVPVVGDTAQPEDTVVGPDVPPGDTTAPTVESTTPSAHEDGVATPFEVKLTFSEPIYPTTLKAGPNGSVSMEDHLGQDVPIELALSEDGLVATLTPMPVDDVWYPSSPYEVHLAPNIIADLAGNKLAMPYTLRFFTAGYPNTGFYKGLAQTYAPRFHIETTDMDPRRRIPTRVDEDGDWDVSNSLSWVGQASAIYPAVYYSVSETYSHYFIHYMAFFPHIATATSAAHGNGTLGAMVTVKKGSGGAANEPLSVTTYWRTKSNEENDVYVTTESGYVGDQSTDWYRVRAVMDGSVLFGEDDHYNAYVSANYESCVWDHEETGGLATCKLQDALKSTMTWLVLEASSDSPDPLTPNEETGWPASMDEIEGVDALGYELVSLADALWPRRLEDGPGELWGDTYAYSNPGRPGDGMIMGSRFVDPLDDLSPPYGRPIWAWKFVPTQGETAGIKQGWLGVDPAFYAHKRHKSIDEDNIFVTWDSEAGTGFSLDYCFNAMVMIDVRETDPECAP